MTKKKLILEYLRNNKHRVLISALCLWSFLHTFILLRFIRVVAVVLDTAGPNKAYSPYDMFYPFTFNGYYYSRSNAEIISHNFDMRFYDFSEYFFYVGGAWLIYLLYRFLFFESISPKSI